MGHLLYSFDIICYLWNDNIFKDFCPHASELSLAKGDFGTLTVHFVDLTDCHARGQLPPFYIGHPIGKRGHEFFEPKLCLQSSLCFVSHSLPRVNAACHSSFFVLVSPVMISVESHACIQRDQLISWVHMLVQQKSINNKSNKCGNLHLVAVSLFSVKHLFVSPPIRERFSNPSMIANFRKITQTHPERVCTAFL